MLKIVSSKITPPIILFLIDHSGSMGESILYSGKLKTHKNTKQLAEIKTGSKIHQLLKESRIYKREKDRLRQMREHWGS